MSFVFLLSFSLGIAIEQAIGINIFIILGIGALIVSAFLMRKKKKTAVHVALVITLFLVGAVQMQLAEINFQQVQMPKSNTIFGRVLSVDDRPEETLVTVKTENGTEVLVRSHEKITLLPGDEIKAVGMAAIPDSFVTATGRMFDYPSYLKARGISYVQDAKNVDLVSTGSFSVSRFFAKLNQDTAQTLAKFVPYPIDGVTGGMLIGDRSAIPKTITDVFQKTGTLHMLVLSGFNITLLVSFLAFLFRRASFYVKVGVLLFGIISLVLLSGAGISAVRAGLMAATALIAQVTGRSYSAARALGVTFVLLLVVNPFLLLGDPGFQLSFLATLCMVAVLRKTEWCFKKVPEKLFFIPLQEIVAVTCTVSIFMLPFIAYFSGTISLTTIPANIIASLFVNTIMILGLVTVTLGAIIPVLGTIVGTVLGVVGDILLKFLTLCSLVPQITLPPFSWIFVALVYALIFFFLYRREIKKPHIA